MAEQWKACLWERGTGAISAFIFPAGHVEAPRRALALPAADQCSGIVFVLCAVPPQGRAQQTLSLKGQTVHQALRVSHHYSALPP